MNLHDYNIIIINSSAGKDSLCSIWEVCRLANEQSYPLDQIVISHQELDEEWPGTKDLVQKQANLFGLKAYFSRRRDKNGYEETLLEYVQRRKKWPSNKQRYCTSDFKRGPGARIVTMLTKDMGDCSVLHVFGFRKEESPARSKKKKLQQNIRLTTKLRKVFDWLPILDWKLNKVWETIHSNLLPYHYAYDLGVPRLSCVYCFFSPFDALVLAGKSNPELLNKYIDTEITIGHTFKNGSAIEDVRKAIEKKYEPEKIKDWVM